MCYMKKIAIPATAKKAPITSLMVSFSFKNTGTKAININTGTVAIKVEAMPNCGKLKCNHPQVKLPGMGQRKSRATNALEAFLSAAPVATTFPSFHH
jgi:hypothetical protein